MILTSWLAYKKIERKKNIYIQTVHIYVTGKEPYCFYENYIKVHIFFEMLFFKVIVIQT